MERKKQIQNNLKTLGLTSGGALAGAGIAGGVTSLLTDSKKARIIAALLGATGGGIGGYALANLFNKSASLRKVASNEQIYKVAKLLKRA
jgi:outer membrane lipoprotein SlyB